MAPSDRREYPRKANGCVPKATRSQEQERDPFVCREHRLPFPLPDSLCKGGEEVK